MKINAFVQFIYSKGSLKRYENKVLMLGSNYKIDINKVLTYKIIILLLTFVISLITYQNGYFWAPVLTVLVYFLYDYIFLDIPIKKRSKIMEHDAIFFFEVLALTLESNRNLKECLSITTEAIDSELSREFKYALNEIKLGKSLSESLNDLKLRIPSKNVRVVLLNIIESNTYGNNIVDSLKNQIDYLMDRRILEIKGQINKIPMKISVVSVFFFIPIILLLVLGPVIINYIFS